MTLYHLKLVPDAEPNADGRIVEIDILSMERIKGWRQSEAHIRRHYDVPPGEHIVAVSRIFE